MSKKQMIEEGVTSEDMDIAAKSVTRLQRAGVSLDDIGLVVAQMLRGKRLRRGLGAKEALAAIRCTLLTIQHHRRELLRSVHEYLVAVELESIKKEKP